MTISSFRPAGFVLSALALAALAGCSVTTIDVKRKTDETSSTIADLSKRATDPGKLAPVPGLQRMGGNFLGAQPIERTNATSLPGHLRNVTLSFGRGGGNFSQVAENIRKGTGLILRRAADVVEPVQMSSPQEPAVQPVVFSQTPLPAPLPLPTGVDRRASEPASVVAYGPIPLSFQGDLTDYLNIIGSALDAHWEYANGEVLFARLQTKRFQLDISPGSVAYRDEVSSGGSGGSSGSQTAGSFASSTSASVEAQLNVWSSIENAIKVMLTPEGKSQVNPASSSIVVTDTKDAVEKIGKYLAGENALLNRQVRIELREMQVEETGATSAGLDFNVVYNRFLNSGLAVDGLTTSASPYYSINTTAPSSLVNAASGAMTLNVLKDGYFQGSTVAAQALNGVGRVVSDNTRSIVTTNRTPARIQDVTDRAYLAKTEPATGGTSDGSSGVPGLTPGVVTYGDNVTVMPTVGANGDVLLQLFNTRSTLVELSTISSGEGSTFQQINTPVLKRANFSQNFRVRNGQTLVIVSNVANSMDSTDRTGITGASTSANKKKVLSVLMITPQVMGI
jgi:type IVB pilus formation R64 PilN family outer membrane protein